MASLDALRHDAIEWARLARYFGDQRKRAFAALMRAPEAELAAHRAVLKVWLDLESLPDQVTAWEAKAQEAAARTAPPGG